MNYTQTSSRELITFYAALHLAVIKKCVSLTAQANDEGFPDRNRMISVMTKQLRDKELRDFYVDSIQECSRMVSQDDPKVQRDNCLYSKGLIICLTERAKMNCADWNAETVLF